MKVFDRYTNFFLIVVFVCLAAIFYRFYTLVSDANQSVILKNNFLSIKNSTFEAIEDAGFLKLNYPVFQKLVDDRKLSFNRKVISSRDGRSSSGNYLGNHSGNIPDAAAEQDAQRKVSWIKVLESAKAHLEIAEMSFEIYPIQSIAGNLQNLEVAVGFESIVLQVSLLHDGVLAALMAYLEEYAPNPFVVTGLNLERAGDGKDSIHFNAEITIRWYLIEVVGVQNDVAS